MFEFVVEKEQNPRKLSDAQALAVASKVGDLWSQWDDARSKQKKIAEKLRPEVYLDERESESHDEDEAWKSDVHLNKIYALNQTQQAFIWDNTYSDIEHLFDVQGTDEESSKMASLQKLNLVNSFYKIGIQRKIDRAIEYLGSVGEICLFVSWKKKYRQIRRRLDAITPNMMQNLVLRSASQNFGIFEEKIYDGPDVDAIDPIDLVFDPKISPEDSEKWDKCGKIIKTWETYDSVANNQLYKLTKSQLADLKRSMDKDSEQRDEASVHKVDDVFDENRIEVLQYWGDFALEDGTILRNWNIISIARKYLAVFEFNRWVINPIINCANLRDSKNKRGIPDLWSIYDLCKEQEKKVNLQNDAQSLNLNPPAYAPEGLFKENKIKLYPGKQVLYKQGLEDPSAIVKMAFPLFNNEDIIQYYDNTASTVSGIFPNMQGQEEEKSATATEINVKVQGQTTRLSKILDTIKQNAIVPMVSKVAELEANMKFGTDTLFLTTDGQGQSYLIDDNIRQGNYEYKYTDNTGIQKRLAENQTLTSILTPVWNDPAVPLDKVEVVKQALTNAGLENTEKFFAPQGVNPQIPQQGTPSTLPVVPAETETQGI